MEAWNICKFQPPSGHNWWPIYAGYYLCFFSIIKDVVYLHVPFPSWRGDLGDSGAFLSKDLAFCSAPEPRPILRVSDSLHPGGQLIRLCLPCGLCSLGWWTQAHLSPSHPCHHFLNPENFPKIPMFSTLHSASAQLIPVFSISFLNFTAEKVSLRLQIFGFQGSDSVGNNTNCVLISAGYFHRGFQTEERVSERGRRYSWNSSKPSVQAKISVHMRKDREMPWWLRKLFEGKKYINCCPWLEMKTSF